MPLATRTILGQGYSPTAPTESQYLAGTAKAQIGQRPPLVYCHGSGDTATTVLAKTGQKPLIDALAQRYAVIVADLGYQAFGNDTHAARISEAIAYLEQTWGTRSRVTLVAGSMGVLGALGYTRVHPDRVRAVAGIIPGLDLADLMLRGAAADINAAYPPAYDDQVHGPTHSPVRYAAGLAPGVPIHLWTASDDTIATPATAAAFVVSRPTTGRTDLGALGHSEAAVAAAQPLVLDWLATT